MKRLLVAILTGTICLAAPAQAQIGEGFGRLLPPRDANAGYKDGLDVLKLCVADDTTELLECLGFLEGVSDTLVADRKAQNLPDCYPKGIGKVDQIVIQQTFIQFMIAHPDRRPQEGASVVRAAIQARFCPR
jgi:hypothetical protein